MTQRIALCMTLLLMGLLTGSRLHAHEVRPAYLEITQSDATHYSIVWKQPTLGLLHLQHLPF